MTGVAFKGVNREAISYGSVTRCCSMEEPRWGSRVATSTTPTAEAGPRYLGVRVAVFQLIPAKLSTSVGTFVISISPAPGPNRSHYRSGALPTLRDPAGAAYACGPGVPMTIAYFSRSFLYVASTIPLWRASIHSRCTASRTSASGLEPPSIRSLT
jgi:hypothetical protein